MNTVPHINQCPVPFGMDCQWGLHNILQMYYHNSKHNIHFARHKINCNVIVFSKINVLSELQIKLWQNKMGNLKFKYLVSHFSPIIAALTEFEAYSASPNIFASNWILHSFLILCSPSFNSTLFYNKCFCRWLHELSIETVVTTYNIVNTKWKTIGQGNLFNTIFFYTITSLHHFNTIFTSLLFPFHTCNTKVIQKYPNITFNEGIYHFIFLKKCSSCITQPIAIIYFFSSTPKHAHFFR